MFAVPGILSRVGGHFTCRIVLLAILWLAPVTAGGAQALRGVALVIGNGQYEHLSALPNPANDARAIESLLASLGFETTLVSDRDARRLARDLDIFIDDAQGADVAVVYYAGHGIEAGGENFLVPVDADLSALDAAGTKLVPVSDFIARLQSTVPLAIVMLDACRDNPFPPQATVRVDMAAEPVPIGGSGLGEARGAQQLTESEPGVESFGTVIGFAAAPGRAALDGGPGSNSPYAAAVLRHLGAMAGEEFGTVMRMVGEEVYLKTSGRQRPWVNESLRRLLYFGRAPDPLGGEEGEILGERRQLLVTIAGLSEFERRQVERAAAEGGMPMDALYGMLKTLGQDAPDDPARLEAMMRAQTERLKALLAERETLKSTDSEIVRLAALADEAIAEGALATALRLHERAKARVVELEATVEDAEADIKARRIEFAQVYARSAEAHAIAFDHLSAAEDYARAYRHVERWDDPLAREYKLAEAIALTDHGNYKGDNAALERAIAAAGQAVRLAEDLGDRDDWAEAQNGLGNALSSLGERESGTARLEQAVEAFRAALQEWTRERAPLGWAATQNNLGNALWRLGERESGTARLEQAVEAYQAALQERTRERVPLDWAITQNNLGTALWSLGERESGTARLEQAVEAFRTALQERTHERVPLDWAATQNSLGLALWRLGERESGTARLEQAVEAYQAALQERTREHVPLDWAATQNNVGLALLSLGERESGTARLEQAIEAFHAGLQEWTRERVPLDWARAQNNLGNALQNLGEREADTQRLEQAVEAYRAALQERTRERVPLEWAMTQNNLGNALQNLGEREGGTARLEQAVEAYHAALQERTRERVPLDWAMIQNNLGSALKSLGEREADTARLEQAIETFRAALQERTRERVPLDWAATQNNLGAALMAIDEREGGTARLEQAIEAFRAALQERTRERLPLRWAMTQNNLGNALWRLGERENDTARLEQAAEAFRAALQERTRERLPLDWAMTQNNLGSALQSLGERESGTARLEQAVEAYRAAIREWTRERVPLDWAMVQHNLGKALVELGRRSGRRTYVAEGRQAILAAWEVYREAGLAQYDDYFEEQIGKADAMLLTLELDTSDPAPPKRRERSELP